jgi:glutathione S-transferase
MSSIALPPELNLQNPVFAAYVVSAMLMTLKVLAMSWLTVVRMSQARGGYRSPEDLRRTALNPDPNPRQLDPVDSVERIRRIHLNDLENVPFFVTTGFLFLFTHPSLAEARWLFYGYAASRFAHLAAYLTAQIHDLRAALWTPGSLILIYMAGRTLFAALGV